MRKTSEAVQGNVERLRYRPVSARLLAAGGALIVGAALLVALARGATAQPAEYLPVGHAAYDEIEFLAARGWLDSLSIYTRPLARIDVARALLRAQRLHPEVVPSPSFGRLERELARELQDLEAPDAPAETGPLVDLGPRERRFRLQSAAHVRGDYDESRDEAHFRLRDETSVSARMGLQIWPALTAYEELGITRIRGERVFVDALAVNTDVEFAVLHAGLTARAGPITAAAGYDEFRWGPGRRGTLLLADAAGPMGFVTLQGTIAGRLTATALSGYVSLAEDKMLAAHRLEFAATPWLTLGIAEAARYSSHGIDLLYGIGLLPYTLVERIHFREASSDSVRGIVRGNVMASADATVRVSPDLTVYGELLVDDFTTEDKTMPDRFGWQVGLRSDRPFGAGSIHVLGEFTTVRNYTYSVYYGESFVYKERPLGYTLGPDVANLLVEVGYDLSRDVQIRWTGDFIDKGEGRVGVPFIPDQSPIDNSGLTGVVEKRREVWGDLRWLPRDNVDAFIGAGYRSRENADNEEGRDETAWLGRLGAELRY
jgi:hypothetical protein